MLTILRPTEQIRRLQKSSSIEHEFSVVWVPRRTLVCNKILEEAGVLGDISVEEFPLYFIPLEHDVLSLTLEDSFGDLYLVISIPSLLLKDLKFADSLQRKDPTTIFLAAQALMLIQQSYGLFPRIIGKGDNARRLMELLFRMRSEALAGNSNPSSSKIAMMPSASIESLIIIDREIDFATVLLTPLTYEGLIDELFGIKDNQTEIDSSVVGPAPGTQASSTTQANPQQQGLKRKIQLDSSDKLYEQVRDTNIAISGRLLNKVARRLESDYESRHVAKSTSELRDFVNKLPGYQSEQQSLKIHTGIAGEIMKYTQSDLFSRVLEVQQNLAEGNDPASQHDTIEELIARAIPLPTVLRLLCLESCVSGGLRPKELDHFKRLILHAYGYQHLLTFDALEKMQLLHARTAGNVPLLPNAIAGGAPAGAKTNYAYLRKALRLIVEEVNEQDPNDIAYVYSGYAPLSVRLVQCVIQKPYLYTITKAGSGTAGAAMTGAGAGASGSSSTAAQGWHGFEDALKSVRGETFNRVQKGEEHASKARHMLSGAGAGAGRTVLVMFLGGISFTEIAALRFIAPREAGVGRRLVCTTDVVSGNGIMEVAIEKGDFGKV